MKYTTRVNEDGETIYVYWCNCAICDMPVEVEQLIPPDEYDCTGIVCEDCASTN